MDPSQFAKILADRTVGRHKDTVWVGEGALMCRIISGLEYYLPFRLWRNIFAWGYGMQRISNRKG
ncbi:hypothetical protein DM02DRAFT_227077 [Periconia macrospinosa]|uniref:Uncharacterized protein n=1 Tax=Periconia macrospinosa TaxID=97972 RepID=A0A2V1E2U6_9PLEO|nr:hypothetical protein DM02DRAFT_227077 [Periconia macrospinosa]